MKSKTCCFNLTLYKKNITHFWPIWLLFFAYLLLQVPICIWTKLMSYLSWDYTTKEVQYDVLSMALSGGISATPLFFASAIAAVAVFSYMYTPKAANMFHALPVSRGELFVTNYLSGLFNLVIPEILAFVVAVFVCLGNQITCIQYLFWWLLYMVAITFFAYSMAVFIGMITGQIFAALIYFFVANFLYIGIRYVLSLMINLICYGIEEGWRPGYSGMLSPWYFMENHLNVQGKYETSYDRCTGLTFEGGKYLIIYAIIAVVFILAAWFLYRKRQIETAGDIISVAWVKPIFRWGIALAGSSLLAVFITNMLQSIKNIPVFVCVIICVILFGFIFFFIAEMFLVKSFKVLKGKRILEWAVFTLSAIVLFSVFRFDVFGIEKKVPEVEDVQAAYLYLDYPVEYTQENVEELIRIHQELLDEKEEFRKINVNQATYVTIKYYLKNDDVILRRYPIPLDEKTVHDTDGVVSELVEIQQREENILCEKFGSAYESNQYMSGYVELYNQDMEMTTAMLDVEGAEKIANALMQDIKDGNLENIVDNYDTQNAPRQYYNAISLSIFNKENMITTSDRFYDYFYYRKNGNDQSTSMDIYFNFNEKCVNTLQVIEDLGIMTDDWGLHFYEDYDNIREGVVLEEDGYMQEDVYVKEDLDS